METFRVDHHYPGSENRSLTVVLYGELGTPEFADFHNILKEQAVEGHIDYVVRHFVRVSIDYFFPISHQPNFFCVL